ncbi:unnamed protein product, partial [Phaeothamnion confervicola]
SGPTCAAPAAAAGGEGPQRCVAERSAVFSRGNKEYVVNSTLKILNYLISTRSFTAAATHPAAQPIFPVGSGPVGIGSAADGGKATADAADGGKATAATPGATSAAAVGRALPATAPATPRGRPLDAKRTFFAWAVPEIRVVAQKGSPGSRHAEYLIVAVNGGELWSSWKRYSDFEKLAAGLKARALFQRNAAGSHTGAGGCGGRGGGEGGGRSEPGDGGFAGAMAVWDLLQKQRRWFRCLEPRYLRLKSYYVEVFLRELLFQATSHEELLDFFQPEFRGSASEAGDVVAGAYESFTAGTLDSSGSLTAMAAATEAEAAAAELATEADASLEAAAAEAGGDAHGPMFSPSSSSGGGKAALFGSRSSSVCSLGLQRTDPSSAASLSVGSGGSGGGGECG